MLSDITKALIYNSVWSYQAQGVGYTDTINKIASKFPEVQTGQDRQQVGAIIRSVRQSQRLGAEIEAGTRGAGDTSGIPIDWSGRLTRCAYQYRVLVKWSNSQTGESNDTLVLVQSTETLDRADIIAGASSAQKSMEYSTKYPTKTHYLSSASQTTFEVIGVGYCP